MSMQNGGSEQRGEIRYTPKKVVDGTDHLLADAVRRAKHIIREHGLDGLPPEPVSEDAQG